MAKQKKPRTRRQVVYRVVIPVGLLATLLANVVWRWDGRGSHLLTPDQAKEVILDSGRSEAEIRAAGQVIYYHVRDNVSLLEAAARRHNGDTAKQLREWLRRIHVMTETKEKPK